MVTKSEKPEKPTDHKPVPPASLFDSRLAESVKDSAQQIWLAGMGAFAKAQAEGTKMFESLVKEGVGLQRKTQSAAEERFADAAERMSTMASEATGKAGTSWGKLENIFEERTAKALNKLGVPTARAVEELTRRVDELSVAVEKLSKPSVEPVARRTAAPVSSPAAKPRAKLPANPPAEPSAKHAGVKTPARKTAARKSPASKPPATDTSAG